MSEWDMALGAKRVSNAYGRVAANAAVTRMLSSSGIRFDSKSVVRGGSELLLASEMALRRLGGDVAEQKLDLIQFAAGGVTETGAGAPQAVRGQLVDPGASRRGADNIHSTWGDMPSPQIRPALLIARNTGRS